MSVLKDYVQLDSRWIEIGGVGQPEHPSIVLSHTSSTGNGTFSDSNMSFFGTEIKSFLKTYYADFGTRCQTAIQQAVNSPGLYTATFSYYGYVENGRLDFEFGFGNANTNIHITSVSLKLLCYVNDNLVGSYSTLSPMVYDDVVKEAKYYDFISDNNKKIYIAINPFERETYNYSSIIYTGNSGKYIQSGYARLTEYIQDFYNIYFWNKPKEAEPDNPIGEQEFSGTNRDSAIGHPELPTVSILNGFHNMYQPDLQVINKVNRGLWTTNFFDNVVKLFNNPIESIVSLTLSPIQPPISDNVTPIIVGNLPMTLTTEGSTEAITSRYLTNQYGTYTFGSMVLYQTYKSFLDYNCSVSIYLPYIGVQKLDIDDVMNSALSLKYNVDFFTGDFVACLQCTKTVGLNSVLYHWKGNILSHIPLSASNFATTYLNGLNTVLSVSQGNTGAIFSNMGSFKPDVSRGGNTSGNVGALDNFEAYIIISKPQENTPDNFKELKGYRSHRKATLKKGIGYVECEEVHVSGTGATDKENEMLEDLLKQGVIL